MQLFLVPIFMLTLVDSGDAEIEGDGPDGRLERWLEATASQPDPEEELPFGDDEEIPGVGPLRPVESPTGKQISVQAAHNDRQSMAKSPYLSREAVKQL